MATKAELEQEIVKLKKQIVEVNADLDKEKDRVVMSDMDLIDEVARLEAENDTINANLDKMQKSSKMIEQQFSQMQIKVNEANRILAIVGKQDVKILSLKAEIFDKGQTLQSIEDSALQIKSEINLKTAMINMR